MNPLNNLVQWFSFKPRTAELSFRLVGIPFSTSYRLRYRHPLTLIFKATAIAAHEKCYDRIRLTYNDYICHTI